MLFLPIYEPYVRIKADAILKKSKRMLELARLEKHGYLFLDHKRKLGFVKLIKKQIDKFALTNEDLGLDLAPI